MFFPAIVWGGNQMDNQESRGWDTGTCWFCPSLKRERRDLFFLAYVFEAIAAKNHLF